MTLTSEIKELLRRDGGEGLYALERNEYSTIYQWVRNEKKKGKDAGITGCRNGEYVVWHEDFRESTKEKIT